MPVRAFEPTPDDPAREKYLALSYQQLGLSTLYILMGQKMLIFGRKLRTI